MNATKHLNCINLDSPSIDQTQSFYFNLPHYTRENELTYKKHIWPAFIFKSLAEKKK